MKSCQIANTSNHTLISWTVRFPKHRFKENFYLGFYIKEKQLASQFVFLIKSKDWVLANIRFIVCLGFFKQDYCSRLLFLANPDCVHSLSKISRTFFESRNKWIIVVFLQRTLTEKLQFVLINTLVLHIPLLALTHPQTKLQRDELILVGLGNLRFLQVKMVSLVLPVS